MADLARIKRNVAKMVSMNAPEADIDGYIASEGVTVDDVRNYGKDYTLGRIGTIDRGLTFGLGRKLEGLYDAAFGKIGDLAYTGGEIVANIQNKGLKGALDDLEKKPSFWERYHEIVDPTMQAIEQYHEDRPKEAFAVEMGASLFNPANKFGVGFIGKGGSLVNKAARSAGVGGVVGGVAGGLNTENAEELPVNVASGVGVGGALGGALPIAAKMIQLPRSLSAAGKAVKDAFTFTPESDAVKNLREIKKLQRNINTGSLDEAMAEAERTGRSVLEVGDDAVLQAAQQARQQTPQARKVLTDYLNDALSEQTQRTRGVIDENLGTEGKYATVNDIMVEAKQKARPIYNELETLGDVAKYETKDIPEQNFKRWFEGSKVVDENGQPRRYYHGSLRKFDEFKQANNDYNFAPDKKFAYNYAESKGFEQGIDAEPQLYEVFLNSKKPFDFENPEDIKNLSNYIKGKKIRVFGNPKKEEEFLRNLKGEYYDTKLDEGEFEKLLSDKYNKWYSPDNHDVNYSQSSVNTDKIFSVNPDEEYFITGSAPWGYNIDDVKSSQIEDAIKNLDFGKNKRHQIPVDIETPYGNRVINIDLKRIDKPSAKNLKRGADNWIDIETADFDGEDLLDALKNMGYDGYYKQENGVKNLSVFNPNQIKSVNNSGAWSSSPSLSDAGWVPESKMANLVNENDVVADAINKVKHSYSSLKNLPDTDAKVLLEARKLLSKQTISNDPTLAYQAKSALSEFDPVFNDITGGKLTQANKIYSDAHKFQEAADLGRDVFNNRQSVEEFKQKMKELTRNEKKAVKIGVRDEMVNRLGAASNENVANKKFLVENTRQKLKAVVGEKQGEQIIDEAEQAVKLYKNANQVLSGSQTAEKTGLREKLTGLRRLVRNPVDTTVDYALSPFDNYNNVRLANALTNPDLAKVYNQMRLQEIIAKAIQPQKIYWMPYLLAAEDYANQ